ncbi:MAG: hypothetical protein HON98_10980 [Chloroflexi bacterium]|jgi:hypothetical protein|nr:hypothetical protein [Chloroflexota bacterium]MBT3670500.1 hypothetical protein [Chloroflexota bacterium]MBT4002250.1 hypothetical protein [Chloroflexota bacterium]MBT4306484.1 hypothetical protein [Chloroflexota bacterium]MBT4534887.1 hypothetical protein [Chloroflexota bacterium]
MKIKHIIIQNKNERAFMLIGVLIFLIFSTFMNPKAALANEELPSIQGPIPMTNDDCLACHQLPDMVRPLPDGGQLYLTVDPIEFKTSIHGRNGYSCVQCHTNITGYPHPELLIETAREFSYQVISQACMQCHSGAAEEYAKGHHAQEYLLGNTNSATCVDCHSAHAVQEFGTSHISIAQTCEKCHSEIYEIYKESVHGEALLENFNPDVPTCVSCHENHNNTGPNDPGYTLFSPQICAECHNDEKLMGKYGINADVFDTYISDFHGSTVVIFEEIAPDQVTNKPVCSDCHGVHDILRHDDTDSSVMKDNIGVTCQRCHPGADLEFSDSWLSHYKPDLENNTSVYLVTIFYWIIIPGTIGGMLFFIFTQVYRKFIIKKQLDDKNKGEGK